MKELSKEFVGEGEVKGFLFKQIMANKKAFLYEIECIETKQKHYEVFVYKYNKRFDCIAYPKSKSFGIWAWSCRSLDKANSRYNELQTVKSNNNKA